MIGFVRTAHLLQPLTEDRDDLAEALQRAGSRAGVVMGGRGQARVYSQRTVDLVDALKKAGSELGQRGSTDRTRVIVVFFAGDDPNLSLHRDALRTMLRSADARLFAVVVPRIEEPEFSPVPQTGRRRFPSPSPVMTTRLLSRLAKDSGGRLFERNWNLRKILSMAGSP